MWNYNVIVSAIILWDCEISFRKIVSGNTHEYLASCFWYVIHYDYTGRNKLENYVIVAQVKLNHELDALVIREQPKCIQL